MRVLDRPSRPRRRPRGRPLRAARRTTAAAVLAWTLCAGLGASAAPTCQDAAGQTVRCEAAGALPVGVSPADDAAGHESAIPLPAPETLFGLVCVLGGLFALIGLMPDFDGWGPGEHEGRRERD